MFGMMAVIVLCSLAGMLLYAKYFDCDPVEAGVRSSKINKRYTFFNADIFI